MQPKSRGCSPNEYIVIRAAFIDDPSWHLILLERILLGSRFLFKRSILSLHFVFYFFFEDSF